MAALNRKLRWGVLGYARIARESVIPAIRQAANSEFHALASREAAKLSEARARFPGLARTYCGYDELLRDPEIDAVYIPLPNALHREWTIKAAEQGKHVLCEKPLALNAAECREMVDACAAHGVVLMEAFMYRYTDRTRQVLGALRSGVLGEIKYLSSTFRFPLGNPASIKWKPELGGGSLYDVGCYPVNFAGMVADEIAHAAPGAVRPESVKAASVSLGGVDVIFSAVMKYSSGMIAAIGSGFNAHRRVFSEIVGTQGVLEIPETFFGGAGALTVTVGENRREIAVAASDRYLLEIEDFSDAVRCCRPPQLGLAESLRNAAVIDQLFAALR